MDLEYLEWISTPEEIKRILKKFGARYLEEIYPPLGHVTSITLEELSRVGKRISTKNLLGGWNKYIEIGGYRYAKVTVPDFLKPVNDLQVNRLGWFLRDLKIPSRILYKIIK